MSTAFPPSRRRSGCRLRVERLEDRLQPAPISWVCGDGDWATPACWDLGRLPEPDDDVVIDRADITVTHSQGTSEVHSVASAAALVLGDGTLRINDPSELDGSLLLQGGRFSGNGEITVHGPLIWDASILGENGYRIRVRAFGGLDILPSGGFKRMEGATLENHGVGVWAGRLWSANPFLGSQFVNKPGALLSVSGVDGFVDFSGFIGQFRNEGFLSSQGSVGCREGISFLNSGYLEVLSGRLALQCQGAGGSGQFYVAAGAELGLRGATTGLDRTAVVWGEGNLAISADQAVISGIIQIGGDLSLGPSYTIQITSPSVVAGGRLLTPSGVNNFRGCQVLVGSVEVEGLSGGSLNLFDGSSLYATAGIRLARGGLSVAADSAAYTPGAVRLTGGGATLTGGILWADQGVYVEGGTLAGHGLVGGALYHTAGQLRLGGAGTATGQLVVFGDYVQAAAATLTAKLGGATPDRYDQLLVSGSAALDGTLTVTTVGGFIPAVGDEFAVVRSAGRSGEFARLNLPTFAGGVLVPEYDDYGLNLVTAAAAPGPGKLRGPPLDLSLLQDIAVAFGSPLNGGLPDFPGDAVQQRALRV